MKQVAFKTVPCRGCGRPIIWAQNPDTGKRVPLDAKAIVYDVIHHEGDGDVVVARTNTSYVSHFNTCPQANAFSGSKKPVKEAPPEFLTQALNEGDGVYRP